MLKDKTTKNKETETKDEKKILPTITRTSFHELFMAYTRLLVCVRPTRTLKH